MRITLVIGAMNSGGAQRVISILANYWAVSGDQVTLLTFEESKNSFFVLDPSITYVPLRIRPRTLKFSLGINTLREILALNPAIKQSKPDAVISFLVATNIPVLISTFFLKIPVIVSERTDPKYQMIGKRLSILRALTYKYADRIVVQTKDAARYFKLLPQNKIMVIPNPVLIPKFSPIEEELPSPSIIAIGRLSEEKGFDLLLKAFSQIKDKHPKWRLLIFGEGPLRQELGKLAKDLGLIDQSEFHAPVKNINNYLSKSAIFVLSSRREGFPNALCEAMACGIAVISTDCPSGPKEIIRDGIDGVLIPKEDIDALAKAMDHLMSDETERKKLGNRAKEIVERYSIDKIMNEWNGMLEKVVK